MQELDNEYNEVERTKRQNIRQMEMLPRQKKELNTSKEVRVAPLSNLGTLNYNSSLNSDLNEINLDSVQAMRNVALIIEHNTIKFEQVVIEIAIGEVYANVLLHMVQECNMTGAVVRTRNMLMNEVVAMVPDGLHANADVIKVVVYDVGVENQSVIIRYDIDQVSSYMKDERKRHVAPHDLSLYAMVTTKSQKLTGATVSVNFEVILGPVCTGI